MSKSIVVVGSLNTDLVTRLDRFPGPGETLKAVDFQKFAGGKGANQAYAASRLGGTVHMVGRVGTDSYGEWLIKQLQAGGVYTTHISRDANTSTGMAFINLDASGQNQIVIVGGANASVTPNDLAPCADLFADAGFVLLQLEIPMPAVIAAARMAKASGAEVILDPAPAAELPNELLQLVDWLTPNQTELATLLRQQLQHSDAINIHDAERYTRALHDRGVKQVVVKRGENGTFWNNGNTSELWPGFTVKAVDTVAAGDVWNGAFAVGLAEKKTPKDAGRFANGAAAISVTRAGAQASMPSRSEVNAFLSG